MLFFLHLLLGPPPHTRCRRGWLRDEPIVVPIGARLSIPQQHYARVVVFVGSTTVAAIGWEHHRVVRVGRSTTGIVGRFNFVGRADVHDHDLGTKLGTEEAQPNVVQHPVSLAIPVPRFLVRAAVQ